MSELCLAPSDQPSCVLFRSLRALGERFYLRLRPAADTKGKVPMSYQDRHCPQRPLLTSLQSLCSSSLIQERKPGTASRVTDTQTSSLPLGFPIHPASHRTALDVGALKTTLLILKFTHTPVSSR